MDGFTRTLIASGWLLCSAGTFAKPPTFEQMLDMDLADLMEVPVTTASRHNQALWQAPAIVSVLDGESLRRQGYRSIAQALTQLPGFFVTYDGVGNYTTVRGISSGQRAYSRTLKVMIDGQPVGIRSTSNPFLGPELIPLAMVDRIEVVRGPSSALYGADAYLGVINIITVQNATGTQTQLAVGDSDGGHTGFGAAAQAAGGADGWHGVVSASGSREDRSGLDLPESSPDYDSFSDTRSANDISRPLSLFARGRYESGHSQHALALHVSERDSYGEFVDAGALSHDNRVVERQQTLWLQSRWAPDTSHSHLLRIAYGWGGNTSEEQLGSTGTTSLPARDYGYRTSEFTLESQFNLHRLHLVAGFDGSWDKEEPYDVFSIDPDTGNSVQLSVPADEELFRNLGVFLQLQYRLSEPGEWQLAFNVRNDEHNRYGNHTSYRAGLTGKLLPSLQLKLLHGSAFKAPNAFQLYANPLFAGDILGNENLQVERASTSEIQLLWQVGSDLSATVTLYNIEVEDLIELQPYNINTRYENRGEQSGHGIETEWRWRIDRHELGLTSSWHDTRVTQATALLPEQETATASAPRLMLRADWRYRWQAWDTGASAHYVSERRASDDNIDANLRIPYELPGYTLWRLYGTYLQGAHRFTLVVDNAFNKDYSEPGYGAIDLPGAPRTYWLSWAWSH